MRPSERFKVPAELALLYDFVNSIDLRSYIENGVPHSASDELASGSQFDSWMRRHKLANPPSRAAHRRALQLREALRAFLKAPPQARANAALDTQLDAVAASFALVVNVSDGIPSLQPGEEASGLALVLAELHNLTLTRQLDRLKMCASDECGWIFFDRSKPGNRRWCSSMRCGNREKTRAYRQRLRSD